MTRFIPLIVFSLGLLTGAAPADEPLKLINGNIVDVTEERVFKGSIVIRDGVIEKVMEGPATDTTTSQGRVVDLSGKFVIPGLFDMHTHAWGNPHPTGKPMALGIQGAAEVMLYSGITGFLDLFSDEGDIFHLRQKQRSGEFVGADIYAAGPCLTAPEGHCSEFPLPTRIIDSPEGAAAEVREVAKHDPDVIKIVYDHAIDGVPTITGATLKAAIGAANEEGIDSVIHIGTWDDAKEAIQYGASAITHLYHEVIPDKVVELAKRNDVVMIPTLGVQRSLLDIYEDPSRLNAPFLQEVTTAGFLEGYADIDPNKPGWQFYLDFMRKNRATNKASFQKLLEAGVTMLPGTDIGNVGTFVGYSLHRELELFVEYGMSPWQTLKAATVDAGKFLGVSSGIEEGARANLTILKSSPIADISATQSISAVVYRGERIDRGELKP